VFCLSKWFQTYFSHYLFDIAGNGCNFRNEKSFSKLKIIKKIFKELNWTRLQEQLSNISVLNIEQCRTKEIDIEKLRQIFQLLKQEK